MRTAEGAPQVCCYYVFCDAKSRTEGVCFFVCFNFQYFTTSPMYTMEKGYLFVYFHLVFFSSKVSVWPCYYGGLCFLCNRLVEDAIMINEDS